MLGAIIGDIVGSRFEFNNRKSKDFELFAEGCFATDDSIMTLAVAKAIMETLKVYPRSGDWYDDDFHALLSDLTVKYMQEIGRKYPNCGFGGKFNKWVFSDDPKPYNSFGNGAAMRVSPAAFAADGEWTAELLAETVTSVTHNHKEGVKGAKATADAIFMARQGALKNEIRERIARDYYPLDFRIDDIRPTYRFNETCQETVPQAIECFLESTSFEDAIRTAISLGGDSDTIGAITGAIAEAYYGVPDNIKEKALDYLDDELRSIYDAWEKFSPADGGRFRVLTKYLGKISASDSIAEHLLDTDFVGYGSLVKSFEDEFHQFGKAHPEYDLNNYVETLKKNGLKWSGEEMRSANPQKLNEHGILALIMGAINAERFCGDALLDFFENCCISNWLKRLKDIDWRRQGRQVASIVFNDNGFFVGDRTSSFAFNSNGAEHNLTKIRGERDTPFSKTTYYSVQEADILKKRFAEIHTEYWNAYYCLPYEVCDGGSWSLTVTYSDGYILRYYGRNAQPENFGELFDYLKVDDFDNLDDEEKER